MLNDQIMVQNSNLYMDFYFKMGKVQTDGSCSGKRKIISPEQGNFFRESKKNRTFFFFSSPHLGTLTRLQNIVL